MKSCFGALIFVSMTLSMACGQLSPSHSGTEDSLVSSSSLKLTDFLANGELDLLLDPTFTGSLVSSQTKGQSKQVQIKSVLHLEEDQATTRPKLIRLLEDVVNWKEMKDTDGDDIFTEIYATDAKWKPIKNKIDGRIDAGGETRFVSGKILMGDVPLLPDHLNTNFSYVLREDGEVITMNQSMAEAFFKVGFIKTAVVEKDQMKVNLYLFPVQDLIIAYAEISIVSSYVGLIDDQMLDNGTSALVQWIDDQI
jgi:hypothetical protein